MLIDEAPYLIDNKAFEKCDMPGVSLKEQFTIKIDSIRKSLGIDDMKDIETLVEVFYSFEAQFRKDEEERKLAEDELFE